MLKWAIIFAVLAVVCGFFGFIVAAHAFAFIAKVLFGLFLVVCVLFLILGFTIAKKV